MQADGLEDLASCTLLAGMARSDLNVLGLRPARRRVMSGEVIIERADTSCDVFFLLSGQVLAVYWTEEGRELIFGRMAAGSMFGEVAALDEAPRSLSVYARCNCEVLVLSQADFLVLIEQVPQFRRNLMKDLTARIRHLTERSFQAAALGVEARVKAYLVRIALESGALLVRGEIRDAPTHTEIANSVGSNREAVSRVMSRLKKTGVIDSGRQRIRLIQPDRLVEEALG